MMALASVAFDAEVFAQVTVNLTVHAVHEARCSILRAHRRTLVEAPSVSMVEERTVDLSFEDIRSFNDILETYYKAVRKNYFP